MRPTNSPSSSIQENAADWLVRRRDGLPREVEARYQAWLAADPRHAAAIAELEATWNSVSFPAAVGRDREAAQVLDRRASARRRRARVLAGSGLTLAIVLAYLALPLRTPSPVVAAVALRPNVEVLADGSKIELNAGAEIAVEYSRERRSVRLVRGEALFSVEKDPARPFVVSAGEVEVRAVGTAFAVRRGQREIDVLVTAGQVAVEITPGAPGGVPSSAEAPLVQPIYLDAGRRVAVATELAGQERPTVKTLSADEIESTLSWRSKRVEFSRMPLSEAAALFNRHNRVQLVVSDRATAALPISGIFWSDDPEGFARLLESGLGVRAEREADSDTITLGRR